jgi:hypothetical protein
LRGIRTHDALRRGTGISPVSPIRRFWSASNRLSCGLKEPKKFAQGFGIVIPGDAIGADDTAALATVQEGHLFSIADPYADGIHDASAQASSIPHRDVHVKASEAARAVVALPRAEGLSRHGGAAVRAEERVGRAVEEVPFERALIARHALTFS